MKEKRPRSPPPPSHTQNSCSPFLFLLRQKKANHKKILLFLFEMRNFRRQKKRGEEVEPLDSCSEIVPGLWIGSLAALKAIDQHERKVEMSHQSWTVISLLGSERLVTLSNFLLSSSSSLLGCKHEVWMLSDTVQGDFLSEELLSFLSQIDRAALPQMENVIDNPPKNHSCLVHCAQGISRSAALCAAWLISRRRMSLEAAIATIRKVRPMVSPNIGFIASLRAIEQCEGDVQKAMIRMQKADNDA